MFAPFAHTCETGGGRTATRTATRLSRLAQRSTGGEEASPSIASLNTLTSVSLNQLVAWVREMDGLRRALAT